MKCVRVCAQNVRRICCCCCCCCQDQARRSAEMANPLSGLLLGAKERRRRGSSNSVSPERRPCLNGAGGNKRQEKPDRASGSGRAITGESYEAVAQKLAGSGGGDGSSSSSPKVGSGIATASQPLSATPTSSSSTAGSALKEQKPKRNRRQSDALRESGSGSSVVPVYPKPRELSAAETLITRHYPQLSQIFGAAHLHTNEPFKLAECLAVTTQGR